ncbi:MAG: 2-oxoglutarate dehydrogenase E1 component [Chitinophagales bacterium]|nr:2-oxoglutarate dehydrogenase E1 component [Chitinophagales bacterium]MDW8428094.1 2-oxoglutarate dehydrogenase E1 component [Chitinophagales bacterium]
MSAFNYLNHAEPAYVESLYEQYRTDPLSVDEAWRKFFEGFDFAVRMLDGGARFATSSEDAAEAKISAERSAADSWSADTVAKEFQVARLITAYRAKGHLIARTNPIRPRKDRKANLHLSFFNLDESDLDKPFYAGELLRMGRATLRQIVERLQKIYCGSIGIEYTYITDPDELHWLQRVYEYGVTSFRFPLEKKKRILQKLNDAVVFEKFLGTKYVGQKRFSLEGGETTIPALDALVTRCAELGAEEIVLGMAHRGRLNVLANIMGKTYENIFNEFEGTVLPDQTMGDGDVKYHLGYSSELVTPNGHKIYVKLVPNPSHLESVDPVVAGFARAKADILYHGDFKRVVPVLLHGDAAIAGQGVVYECLQMSQLNGYHVGGTIHFVINNQIGFTTDFDDARSSFYCTSLAATVQAPVLHVNGDDPEAVVFAIELAADYRHRFHKDVFVDMVCYRRHGHNEGDDPKYTQPRLYELISKHPNPREIYTKVLIDRGDIEAELAREMNNSFWKQLQDRLDFVKQHPLPYTYQPPELAWRRLRRATPDDFVASPETAVAPHVIEHIAQHLTTIPDSIDALPKVRQLLNKQRDAFAADKIDWAMAEMLAYGTLLLEGFDVRLSGQDSVRGTFSHRHAVIYDQSGTHFYNRLESLQPPPGHQAQRIGRFRIYNSLLSEFGVLGFEYGYSLATPDALVLWEAQFGDFSNGAQTIIDQYISSGESKWNRMSGLVLLLPHGYEGQGAEHSSARLERYLQLSADLNWIVVNPTTPANFFHGLRRQLAYPFRKPLVVMSPKSLLRHPRCISSRDQLSRGGFQEVIDDASVTKPRNIRRVLLCSGKIYFELLEYKERLRRDDIALVRMEQIYPLPAAQLERLLDQYRAATFVWVQEEPYNMGAYSFLKMNWKWREKELYGITRKASAAPATGFYKIHVQEQEEILRKAFE